MKQSTRMWRENPLAQYMRSKLGGRIGTPWIDETLKAYNVGSARRWGGSTVFWQVDGGGKVRTGRVVGFDPDTGEAVEGQSDYAHILMADRLPGFTAHECYFGTHLVRSARTCRRVLLFESEKTALTVAAVVRRAGFQNEIVCLGCDPSGPGAPCLNPVDQYYSPTFVLRGENVIMIPDQGHYAQWCRCAEALRPVCPSVVVTDVMETLRAGQPEFVAEGASYGDYIIARLDAYVHIFRILYELCILVAPVLAVRLVQSYLSFTREST